MRFLDPEKRGAPKLANPMKAQDKRKEKFPESGMKDVLLSGCSDKEYSYDALIEGKYHGAMTHFALKTIREANYAITYRDLHARLQYLLDDEGYPQHPQLEGKTTNKKRQLFS